MAPTALRQVAEDAVLSANYLLASLKDVMSAPYEGHACMRRCSMMNS
jgi:glycine cleavage system protein P-like pyridoxal-binding family